MFGPGLCRNGRCLNTVPGYICLCNPGYHYNAARRKCEGEDACHPSPPRGPQLNVPPPPCQAAHFWLEVSPFPREDARCSRGRGCLMASHPWAGASQAGREVGGPLSVTRNPHSLKAAVGGHSAWALPPMFLPVSLPPRSRRVPGHGL